MRHGGRDGEVVSESYSNYAVGQQILGGIFKIVQHWLHSLPFQFLEASMGRKLGQC